VSKWRSNLKLKISSFLTIKPEGYSYLGNIIEFLEMNDFKICRMKMISISEQSLTKMSTFQEIEDSRSFIGVNVIIEVLRDNAVDALLSAAGTLKIFNHRQRV
jgi:nucleoside diphosphate kinase